MIYPCNFLTFRDLYCIQLWLNFNCKKLYSELVSKMLTDVHKRKFFDVFVTVWRGNKMFLERLLVVMKGGFATWENKANKNDWKGGTLVTQRPRNSRQFCLRERSCDPLVQLLDVKTLKSYVTWTKGPALLSYMLTTNSHIPYIWNRNWFRWAQFNPHTVRT